ncbi:MAG: glutaredoxin family protein [Wenzhouxiangella sp.]
MRGFSWTLALGLVALSLAVLWHTGRVQVTAADISTEHELVFFSAPWCGYCDRARSWFDAQGVDYLEINIESSTEAHNLWREAGGRGVPLVLVGEQRIAGYAPAAFASALGLER